MRVIVFSKDRPLQLEGYLASLLHCSGLPQTAVTVVYVDDPAYAPLLAQYPAVDWAPEAARGQGGFHATLAHAIAALPDDEPVLFGCDDVVFFNPFDSAKMEAHLRAHPECAGITVRYGSNTDFRGAKLIAPGTPAGAVVEWEANGADRPPAEAKLHRGFFAYPFEVMGTAYRAGLVRRMFAVVEAKEDVRYRGPNDFEAMGMRMLRAKRTGWARRLWQKLRGQTPAVGEGAQLLSPVRLAMFNAPSCCAAQDVNRVQDIAQNAVKGGAAEDAETLKRKFLAGWRMQWRHMQGITPPDCFVGMDYWELIPPPDAGGAK